MAHRMTPSQLREHFVAEATRKFASNVPDFVRLQQLIADNGGTFVNDHGAIRTADPALCELFVRAAGVLGLQRERSYLFPSKKLISFDLQVIGEAASEFKIFVSQVDLGAFPGDVAEAIRQDCAQQAAAVQHEAFIGSLYRSPMLARE